MDLVGRAVCVDEPASFVGPSKDGAVEIAHICETAFLEIAGEQGRAISDRTVDDDWRLGSGSQLPELSDSIACYSMRSWQVADCKFAFVAHIEKNELVDLSRKFFGGYRLNIGELLPEPGAIICESVVR